MNYGSFMSKQEIIRLWYHIARLRLAKGDKEGAEQAKNNARIIKNAVRS